MKWFNGVVYRIYSVIVNFDIEVNLIPVVRGVVSRVAAHYDLE